MRNAKAELLEELSTRLVLKCATIIFDKGYGEGIKEINLKVGYSPKEYQAFLSKLDFIYDAGFGGQELYGTCWLTDGTWLSRGEYDGSEWWEHNKLPEIPKSLL